MSVSTEKLDKLEIHVFPNENIYNSNKSNIPSNALALVENMTGFSQNLQENGWCKMPNGLILQWGNKIWAGGGERYEEFIFPIAFTKVLAITTGNNFIYNNHDSDIRDLKDLTNTKVKINPAYGTKYIIAIGY